MDFRTLQKHEITKFNEIDRSEIIENIYILKSGKLGLVKEYYHIKEWNSDQIESYVKILDGLDDRNGALYGAFDRSLLVGLIALDSTMIGESKNYLKMDKLYISKDYRNKGIGNRLVEMAKEKAKELGATKLYISATPSENTINFYLHIGCTLTEEVIKELYDLEPEDIHLELKLMD
jgi:predicted N-acetyltransferase YhbS